MEINKNIMKKIWLVRHAESKAQTEEEFSFDSGLSDNGKEQAKRLKKALGHIHFDKIFLSPLKRTRETFEVSELKHDNVVFDSRIIEALPASMYKPLLPYPELPDYGVPDKQNAWLNDIQVNAKDFLEDLYKIEEKNVLVLSHAGFLSTLLNYFLSEYHGDILDPYFKYCAMQNTGISVIFVSKRKRTDDRLLVWNHIAHVSDLLNVNFMAPIEELPENFI